MNINNDYFLSLNTDKLIEADPKDYILFLAHSLRLGALYKAKFFMWIENNNYELIAQDKESVSHLITETVSIYKKAVSTVNEEKVDFLDNIFFTVLDKTGKFEEQDCISLSLCLLAFTSYKCNLISNEEYLEIRDLLVPYKVMVSQCKVKAEELINLYKSEIEAKDMQIKLLCKLGKGVVYDLPDISVIDEAFKEITYDEKSWEKE